MWLNNMLKKVNLLNMQKLTSSIFSIVVKILASVDTTHANENTLFFKIIL